MSLGREVMSYITALHRPSKAARVNIQAVR